MSLKRRIKVVFSDESWDPLRADPFCGLFLCSAVVYYLNKNVLRNRLRSKSGVGGDDGRKSIDSDDDKGKEQDYFYFTSSYTSRQFL